MSPKTLKILKKVYLGILLRRSYFKRKLLSNDRKHPIASHHAAINQRYVPRHTSNMGRTPNPLSFLANREALSTTRTFSQTKV